MNDREFGQFSEHYWEGFEEWESKFSRAFDARMGWAIRQLALREDHAIMAGTAVKADTTKVPDTLREMVEGSK